MNLYDTTFKRYEKKYMLDSFQRDALLEMIKAHIEPDIYSRYTIQNIYYDTQNYELIRRSIEKPVYKEKFRVRTYGDASAEDKIFFELKKKYKKEVFKRRVSLTADDFAEHLSSGYTPDGCTQILGEIDYFMSVYKPVPKVYIAYERAAFSGRHDAGLRITFDENIRFRTDDLSFEAGDHGTKILEPGKVLMEIKTIMAMPFWLSNALNELKIYPASFSKYGHCYQNYILETQFDHAKSTSVGKTVA